MADPSIGKFFAKAAEKLCEEHKLHGKAEMAGFASGELAKYREGRAPCLNKIMALDIFRPDGMKAALKPYHPQIEAFRAWLIKQGFGGGAEGLGELRELAKAEFKAADLIEIGGARIAVGYGSPPAPPAQGGADFGIELAAWPPEAGGMACGKLPTARIAMIRQADILREILLLAER